MLRSKCHIKKDDKVKIIAGKDNGKVGKVLKVDRKKQRILVENANTVKRHTRPSAQNRQGGADSCVERDVAVQQMHQTGPN